MIISHHKRKSNIMRIVYANWNCFGAIDMFETLLQLGHEVKVIEIPEKAFGGEYQEFSDSLYAVIRETRAELVVSFNYYPFISQACMRTGCRYFSWIYDSPFLKVYDASVNNNVNYVGTFDSYMADELSGKGVNTIHYIPLAVNTERIAGTIAKNRSNKICGDRGDIEFVGSMYNNRNRFYERLFETSRDMELAGYLDALVEAQRRVYGCNFLEECLEGEVLEKIDRVMLYKIEKNSYISKPRVYADYYICPRIAFIDRKGLIGAMSGCGFKIDYFTESDYSIPGARNRGSIDYLNEMPVVFNTYKINLNISLRSIRTGIPLRAMDIMGSGGFLLTNYQQDMLRHFEPGKHFVQYTSIEEALELSAYYLEHEQERSRIASAALAEIEKHHTYKVRLKEILSDCM